MLSNWQLSHSLQAYNPLSPFSATRSLRPIANNMPKTRSCNEWNKTKAKASDFKITLSPGAKEDEERVSFLELQIQQAKAKYESALKNVIKECIALEIPAAKKEETQLIMDLLPTIGTAIQKLQGIECSAHLQTVNVLKMAPTLLQYGPIPTMNTFLAFYQPHHRLDDVPNPMIRIMEDEYPTVEERTKAMHFHTTLLQ